MNQINIIVGCIGYVKQYMALFEKEKNLNISSLSSNSNLNHL